MSTSFFDDPGWETVLRTITGRSTIDAPRTDLRTLDHAEDYLAAYGFDWRTPQHRRELERLRLGAIALIEEELLAPGALVHPSVRRQKDVRKLLVWASEPTGTARALWSCAMLRCIHALAHCHLYFNERYGAEIRHQILRRFEPHIHMSHAGLTLGRGASAIELESFQVRPTKTARSVALKLLYKAENVAVDVFDWVGVRFVTKERFDALLVVKYLREQHVISFANAKPTRNKNTLIDLDWLRGEAAELRELQRAGQLDDAQLVAALRRRARQRPYPAPPLPAHNPFSSMAYHAIQFTCRQLVRVAEPAGDLAGTQEIRFFFPFEIQVLDEASYRQSQAGLAAHAQYKERQREAVRQRVLGALLDE